MLTTEEVRQAQAGAAEMLAAVGIAITAAERSAIEVADCGLSDLARFGVQILTYVNTDRVCAKELVLFPGQICPEHRHPPFEGTPGKEETFRCRVGTVFLYTEGPPTEAPACELPGPAFTARCEIVLGAGDQHTIPPNTLHWFQAGPDGAVISEFSTQSRDDLDLFTDPAIQRTTVMKD